MEIDAKTLAQIKQDIIDGKISLRSAAQKCGVDRDILKGEIERTITQEDESKSFRDRMKLNYASSTVALDDDVQNIVVSILKGEITAKEASEKYHLDRETIRRKIDEFVQKDKRYLKLYLQYCAKSSVDYGHINFKGLIVYMLRENMSQSEMAGEYGIPARTISRAVEKIGESDKPQDRKLYNIAKICADRKMKRQELSDYEIDLYRRILDELFPNISIIEFDSKSPVEQEIQRLEEFCRRVDECAERKMTQAKIAKSLGVGISTIRRNRLKLEELKRQEEYKRSLKDLEEGYGL